MPKPTPEEIRDNIAKHIVGSMVVEIRDMTDAELDAEGWSDCNTTTVLVLNNGIKLYPSADGEGNRPGAMFGTFLQSSWSI